MANFYEFWTKLAEPTNEVSWEELDQMKFQDIQRRLKFIERIAENHLNLRATAARWGGRKPLDMLAKEVDDFYDRIRQEYS
jgi:hypothetical protein